MRACLTKSCCTEECYEKSCKEPTMIILLTVCAVIIAALLIFSIYLVVKPSACEQKAKKSEIENRIYRRYLQDHIECKTTSISLYPQLAAIIERDSHVHVCTGVILSENWMLTAAHCLLLCEDTVTCSNLNVRVGSTYANKGGIILLIEQFEFHPEFNASTLDNDVGLLKVYSFKLDGRNTKAAKLDFMLEKSGIQYGQVLTWTLISKANIKYRDNILRINNLTVESHTVCRHQIKGKRGTFKLSENMLCGISTSKCCYIESGAPIFKKDILFGIVIFSQIDFNIDYYINIFIDIYKYTDFITSFVGIPNGNRTE